MKFPLSLMIITTILLMLLSTFSTFAYLYINKNQEVNFKFKEFEEKFDILYELNQSEAYSGLFEEFYENGKLAIRKKYKDGRLDGVVNLWHSNGQKAYEGSYKDGKKNGSHILWHSNGFYRMVSNFTDDNQQGLFIRQRLDGAKIQEGNYLDGEKTGRHNLWYKNGQIALEVLYDLISKQQLSYKAWMPHGTETNRVQIDNLLDADNLIRKVFLYRTNPDNLSRQMGVGYAKTDNKLKDGTDKFFPPCLNSSEVCKVL